MRLKRSIKEYVAVGLMALAVISCVLSVDIGARKGNVSAAARRMERELDRKVATLDEYMSAALYSEGWLDMKGLPEDMVIYRYVADSLQSWQHLFPIRNDDISFRVLYQRLSNPRSEMVSPLMDIAGEPVFKSFGDEDYLLKSVADGKRKVIGGLRLRGSPQFSLISLLESEGDPVSVDGVPVFRLASERMAPSAVERVPMLWLAVFAIVASMLVLLSDERTLRRLALALGVISAVLLTFYLWGQTVQDSPTIFSPIIFAGGTLFYSLGAVLILNLEMQVCAAAIFIVRKIARGNRVLRAVSASLALWIPVYSFIVLRSVSLNSDIELELFKLGQVNWYTAIVYSSLLPLLSFIPLLLHVAYPQGIRAGRWRLRSLSARGRTVFSFITGVFLTAVVGVLGVKKDISRMETWASRLAMDRDISLELQMRSVEKAIGEDAFIGSLSALGNTSTILGRLSDTYFPRLSQSYGMVVSVLDPSDAAPEQMSAFNDRLTRGVPISEGSHFLYVETSRGTARYCGIFTYMDPTYGAFHLLIEIEPRIEHKEHGFSSILGMAPAGRVNLPRIFSYARYYEGRLSYSRGNHSYPTVEPHWPSARFTGDGKIHSVVRISDQENVVISRPRVSFAVYSLSAAFLSLLLFLCSGAPLMRRHRRRNAPVRNYYRSRVTSVLVISLIVTLVAMASASVLFVYKRNAQNLHGIMSDKITSLQMHVESRCSYMTDTKEMTSQEFSSELEQLGEISKLDITLFTPSGRAFFTTAPEVYERRLVSGRMDGDAYSNIVLNSRRYYIHGESIASTRFYAMYAPITNADGRLLAVIGSPYTPESYDFGREVVLHSSAILLVFILLLIMSRFMTAAIVDKMFRPLMALGRRMGAGDVASLEHLEYYRDDEISSLVQSYNRMVDELSESTLQLANAERDKAWSAMARQVAHEIKNPLTPMKLQLQRIVRLKSRGDDSWQEKFDEMARVMLYHIDVLSDTANEFSTFAKLYTEEHTDIDLDILLQEEISMFDSKGSVHFVYMGLPGCVVSGPKPQLTRVFVNILANAVQAVSADGADDAAALAASDKESGAAPAPAPAPTPADRGVSPYYKGNVAPPLSAVVSPYHEGNVAPPLSAVAAPYHEVNVAPPLSAGAAELAEPQVLVSLRKGVKDGYYDIVFEDNGPGVPQENIDRLFIPNFTTKSGGTGLGLAISRSILQRCGAVITYSKSFALGGACFTISYPGKEVQKS